MSRFKIRILGGFCKNGHILTKENTYFIKKTGYLQCKICQLNYQRHKRGINSVLRDASAVKLDEELLEFVGKEK